MPRQETTSVSEEPRAPEGEVVYSQPQDGQETADPPEEHQLDLGMFEDVPSSSQVVSISVSGFASVAVSRAGEYPAWDSSTLAQRRHRLRQGYGV